MFTVLFDLIFPPREDELVLRNVPADLFATLTAPTLISGTELPTIALLPFADARVRAAVHEAKYHGNRTAFCLLGGVLGEYLLGLECEEGFSSAVLVPIPLSHERRSARGYNQAEELARSALRSFSEVGPRISMDTTLLTRTRDTVSQTHLARWERRANLHNAFVAPHPVDPSFTYLLIDDVTTTGATLEAAAEALRTAGATHILPIAIAH